MYQALIDSALFLLQVLLGLCTWLFVLRFILQAVRGNFYNPVTQLIVRLTDTIAAPVRKLAPPVANFDSASLLLAILMQVVLVIALMYPAWPGPGIVLALSGFRLVDMILSLYFWALLLIVIVSWVAPYTRHPGLELLHEITEPLLAPLRRLLPPAGGLDFSVLVAFLLLSIVERFLLPGLMAELGLGVGSGY